MFKSIKSIPKREEYIIEYSNGDTDIIPELDDLFSPDIIKCFEERGLNVPSNIVRLMIYDEKIHGIPFKESMENWPKIKEFEKYKDDVEKLLLLV